MRFASPVYLRVAVNVCLRVAALVGVHFAAPVLLHRAAPFCLRLVLQKPFAHAAPILTQCTTAASGVEGARRSTRR